jgi:membrane protein
MARYLGGLSWADLAKRTIRDTMAHNVVDQAAELAFYFLMALFPLLIFLISIVGLVASRSGLDAQLVHWLTETMPHSASGIVQHVVQQTTHGAGSGKLSFGIALSLYMASSGMVAVIEGLNTAFNRQPRSWIKQRFTALWLTVVIGFFMLLAVGIILFGNWIVGWMGGRVGLGSLAALFWEIVQWPVAVFLVILAFAIVYRYAPNKQRAAWKWITPGAGIGVLLWLAASFGFRVYLMYFNTYASTYGSLGAVIVLMMWFYITAIAILLGGEVDAEVEAMHSRSEAANQQPASSTHRQEPEAA